jgi:hypothetical protein
MVVVAAFAASTAGGAAARITLTRRWTKVCRQCGQPINLILGPAVDDRHVLALDIACLLEALAKSPKTVHHRVRGPGVEDPDHWHRWLLRLHRERPRRRRAAEQRYELAPFHSITSTARCVGGGAVRATKRVLGSVPFARRR